MNRSASLLLIAALALLVTACGHRPKTIGTEPVPYASTTKQTGEDRQGDTASTEQEPSPPLAPELPRATTLGGPLAFASAQTPEELSLLEHLRSMPDANTVVVNGKTDDRLRWAARELSRYYALRQVVPPSRFRAMMLEWVGLAEPQTEYFHVAKWPEDPIEEQDEAIRQWLSDVAARGPITHLEVGRHLLEQPGKHTVEYLTILALRRKVDLEPIAWRIDIAERIYLKGHVLDADATDKTERYVLYLQFLDEAVFEAPVKVRDGRFSVEVQIPQAHAAYTAELVRVRREQAQALVRLVFYYNSEPPALFEETTAPPSCADPASCEERLHAIIAKARAEAGRETLLTDPAMIGVTRRQAQEMIDRHYSSIVDLRGHRLDDRLRLAGEPCLQAGEIVDGDYHFESILERLEKNPALKSFVQNPSFTHQGCGLALKTDRRERTYYAMSCGLATFMDRTPLAELPKALLERINAERGKNKKAWLTLREDGKKLAAYAVEELWRNLDNHRDVQQKVMSAIEQGAVSGKNFQFGLFTLYSLHQLAEKSHAQDLFTSPADSLILGILRVSEPDKNPKGIFIYYMLYDHVEQPRPAKKPAW